jgi:hypothetical protein
MVAQVGAHLLGWPPLEVGVSLQVPGKLWPPGLGEAICGRHCFLQEVLHACPGPKSLQCGLATPSDEDPFHLPEQTGTRQARRVSSATCHGEGTQDIG